MSRLADGIKNLQDAIETHQKAEDQSDNTNPITKAELRTEIPISVKTYAQRGIKEKIWGVTKGILEVAVAIAVIGYTGLTYELLQENIDATNLVSRQTKLSRQALNETVKNFRVDQRPYIVDTYPVFAVPGLIANADLVVNVTWKNIGRTPALKQITMLRLEPYFGPDKGTKRQRMMAFRKFLNDTFKAFHRGEIIARKERESVPHAEDDLAPNGDFFNSNPNPIRLNEVQLRGIMSEPPKGSLYLTGMSTYVDAFGNHYETTACWKYFGHDSKLWHRCGVYQTIR